MMRNPEFQRQLWLNWRPSLLGWSIGLVAVALAVPLAAAAKHERMQFVGVTAMVLMWVAAVVYGSVLASRSLSEEASQNTWDWQRLSALTPWQMAWGKLLGATTPAWLYVLWFAMVVNFLSATFAQLGLGMLGLHSMLLALIWGLAMQSWAMGSVLLGWSTQDRSNRRRTVYLPFLLVFLLPGPLLSRLAKALFNTNEMPALWWGMDVGSKGIAYLMGLVALGLGLLALWRLLCTRLDMRTLPWAWPVGLAVAGFAVSGVFCADLSAALAWTSCFALAGTIYMALQSMDEGLRSWRQVQWSVSQGRWRQALQALPLWPVSWVLAAVSCGLWLLWPLPVEEEALQHLPASVGTTWMVLLQVLRDCAILTGFSLLSGRLKSPMAAFWICMLILNAILPIVGATILRDAHAIAVLQPVAGLIWGQSEISHNGLPWLSMAVHLLLALGWATHVFRQRVLGYTREGQPTLAR